MKKKIIGLVRGEGVRARALRGTAISLLHAFGEQGLRFVSNLILTRLLFPEAFGLMAIASAILVAFEVLSDIGMRSSVIQSPRGDDENFLNTIWTLKCIRGVFLWLIICATAPFFAGVYDQPILAQILPVAGLGVFIAGFLPSKELSVSRHLQLGQLMILRLSAQFIGLCCMSLLAWQLETVWALVFGTLVQRFVELVLCWRYLPGIRNRFYLERESVWEILNFGKYLFIGAFAGYLMNQSDRAVLGFFIPIDLLGVYNIAFVLTSLPLMLAKRIVSSVVFPLYRIRHPLDGEGNRKNILRARRLVSLLALGVLCAFAFIAPWLIEVLYDDRYILAGPIAVLLCLGLVPSVVLNGTLYAAVAKGDTLRFMILNVATALCKGGLLYLAVMSFGMVGAPLAAGVAPLLTYPLMAVFLKRYNNWDPLGDVVLMTGACTLIGLSIWFHFDRIQLILP